MSDNIDWHSKEYETKGYVADDLVRKKRIEICENCESLTKLKICKECGCFMPVKIWIKFIDCPIEKWAREKE